jgi:hypothetical protein
LLTTPTIRNDAKPPAIRFAPKAKR